MFGAPKLISVILESLITQSLKTESLGTRTLRTRSKGHRYQEQGRYWGLLAILLLLLLLLLLVLLVLLGTRTLLEALISHSLSFDPSNRISSAVENTDASMCLVSFVQELMDLRDEAALQVGWR